MTLAAQPSDERVRLLRQLRTIGPWEDWLAESSPESQLLPRVLARRISRQVTESREILESRLAQISRLSELVAHPYIVATCGLAKTNAGELVQLSELIDGVDLGYCLRAGAKFPMVTSVWLVRQVLEAIQHAHSLEEMHGAIGPTSIWVRRDGEIMVDFGLANQLELIKGKDIYAVALLMSELLDENIQLVPIELKNLIDFIYSSPLSELSMYYISEELNRIFYVILDGEDIFHGKAEISNLMCNILPHNTSKEISIYNGYGILQQASLLDDSDKSPMAISTAEIIESHSFDVETACEPISRPISHTSLGLNSLTLTEPAMPDLSKTSNSTAFDEERPSNSTLSISREITKELLAVNSDPYQFSGEETVELHKLSLPHQILDILLQHWRLILLALGVTIFLVVVI